MKNTTNHIVLDETPMAVTVKDLAIGQIFRYVSSGSSTPNIYIKTDQRSEDGVNHERYRIVNLRTGAFYTPSNANAVVALTKPVTIHPGKGD